MTKVVALVSGKGGSGKTTLSTNLACAAVEAGRSALVPDLDQQANATGWHEARTDKTAPAVLPTHHAALKGIVEAARAQGVDFIFIDTAAKTEGAARSAVDVADVVLIPCQPSAHDLRAIQDTVELCRARGATPYVVLNEVEANSPLTGEARAALDAMGIIVLPMVIGRRRAFIHTATDGRGVVEFEKRGKAAEEIRLLYKAISKLSSKIASNQPSLVMA